MRKGELTAIIWSVVGATGYATAMIVVGLNVIGY